MRLGVECFGNCLEVWCGVGRLLQRKKVKINSRKWTMRLIQLANELRNIIDKFNSIFGKFIKKFPPVIQYFSFPIFCEINLSRKSYLLSKHIADARIASLYNISILSISFDRYLSWEFEMILTSISINEFLLFRLLACRHKEERERERLCEV
jgi:hypothetical protein